MSMNHENLICISAIGLTMLNASKNIWKALESRIISWSVAFDLFPVAVRQMMLFTPSRHFTKSSWIKVNFFVLSEVIRDLMWSQAASQSDWIIPSTRSPWLLRSPSRASLNQGNKI